MFYSAGNMAAASEAHGRFLSQHALRPDTLHKQKNSVVMKSQSNNKQGLSTTNLN